MALLGCGTEADKTPLYGAPTPLPEDVPPAELLCQIRDEFSNLPMPLLDSMTYQGPWTRRPIGAAPVSHRGFHRIHLRPEGLRFLESHARIEIVASLAPMIVDPDYGGEAAMLLAGIPAGTDADQGRLTRYLAQQLYDSGYRSPDRRGAWDQFAGRTLSAIARLYGMTNRTSRIHERRIPEYRGSLEEALVELLEDFERSAPRLTSAVYRAFEPPPLQGSVAEWAQGRAAPALADDVSDFIDRHDRSFATMALFPLTVQESNNLGVREHVLMWLLGIQDTYWPTVIQRATGNELVAPLTSDFREQSAELVYALCPRNHESAAKLR